MKLIEVLEKALDLVSKNWVQGKPRTDQIRERAYGIDGALLVASNRQIDLEQMAHAAVIDALGWSVEEPIIQLGAWNDHPSRTQQEVVEALRKAIEYVLGGTR